MTFRHIFGALLALVVITVSAQAAAERDDGSVAIQLKSIGLPAISEKGYRGRTTVTPYIEVTNEDAIERFCGRLPRVVDAILIAFEEKPVDLKDKNGDLASRQGDLGRHIEEAVGTGVFKRLHLVAGSKRRGAGSEMISSRYGTRDCQPVAYLPWEKPSPKELGTVAESATNAQPVTTAGPETAGQGTATTTEQTIAEPIRELPAKSFPAPPIVGKGPSWIVITIALIAMSGFTIVIGSYIGYQVAKIRRERRRKDRRMKKKDRRSGLERRLAEGPLPEGGERRTGADRRSGIDRRDAQDRRSKRDRRDEVGDNASE